MSGGSDAPPPVRVKICGVTRPVDAALAVELGADAVGMVFWPASPRAVGIAAACAIAASVPPQVTVVGVFVDADAREIARIADQVPLGAIQLHGDEPVTLLDELTRPVLRAVSLERPGAESLLETLPAWVTVLLDAYDPARRGGTGRMVDWDRAARWARRRPLFLAGGLNASNIADAVRRVRPYGVDVSSGVEREPGVKDAERLRALFAALRSDPTREADVDERGR